VKTYWTCSSRGSESDTGPPMWIVLEQSSCPVDTARSGHCGRVADSDQLDTVNKPWTGRRATAGMSPQNSSLSTPTLWATVRLFLGVKSHTLYIVT